MRILFLTHRLPYAPNRGDRVRALHLLRHLSGWAEVDLVSLVHDADEASRAADLTGVATTVTTIPVTRVRNLVQSAFALPTDRPLTHVLLNGSTAYEAIDEVVRAHRPDVVLAYCSSMARFALEPPLAGIPMVLDMVDVDSEKWSALARTAGPARSWIYAREARTLARFEARAARAAAATLVVTDRERDSLARLAPDARIEIAPNGVDVERLRPETPPTGAPIAVFCGVLDYEPNIDAASWLAREIWPLVRATRPDARLQIVGARPTRAVIDRANAARGIEIHANVPDVKPYLWNAAIAVAPLRTARGIQNKVLEAVAAGLPTVATSLVIQGVPAAARGACIAADNARAFAQAIITLLAEPAEARRARSDRADLDQLTWDRALAPLRAIVTDACASRR